MRYRIALYVPDLSGGGAERVVVNLANAFVTLGHSVVLVADRPGGKYSDQLNSELELVVLHARKTVFAAPKLARWMKLWKPQILISVLTYNNVAAVVARRLAQTSTRVVISEHSVTRLKSWSNLVRWGVTRLFYKWADITVAVSKAVATQVLRAGGLQRQNVIIISNPVVSPSLTTLAHSPPQHPWLMEGVVPIILAVGRLVPEKDYQTLIRAFKLVRMERLCRLIILGEGPQRQVLERLAATLKVEDDVAMPGFMANPFSWMARSQAVVVSSLWESFGNTLVEAMACGTSVVSTDCMGGPSEILDGGTYGRLVPVGDVGALAAALVVTLDHPTDPALLRARASEFTAERIAQKYLAACQMD